MMHSLTAISLPDLPWNYIAAATGLLLVSLVISLAVIAALLVTLPQTYFLDSHDRGLWIDRHPAIRWTGIVAKNMLGLAILLVGLALLVPGVPGQGLLTILIGLVLLDFPGKRRLERRILGIPRVLRRVDGLRARFGKPALILDESPQHSSSSHATKTRDACEGDVP